MAFTLTGKSYGKAIADIEFEKGQKAKRRRASPRVWGSRLPQEEEAVHTIPELTAGSKYRFNRLIRNAGEGKITFEMYFCRTGELSGGRVLYLFRRGEHVGLESFTEQQMSDYKVEAV